MHKPVVLIVLDGWGYREETSHNAIAQASTPFFDHLWEYYPHALLSASEESVGLPKGQIGNSEVGHVTIGAGKVIDTELVRISKAARAGEFGTNPAFVKLFSHVLQNDSVLHVMGLVSPGGIHSHQEHLHAFIRAAKHAGISKVAVHVFTDGRDTPPQSAVEYIKDLEQVLDNEQVGVIATLAGRFYAMDRDTNWDRIEKAGDAIFYGKGKAGGRQKASAVVGEFYSQGLSDEHLEPVVFLGDDEKEILLQKNDGVFFFNFRADRARQLAKKISDRVEDLGLAFVTLTEYEPSLTCTVAFPPQAVETTIAREISHAGLRQAHIAETEKYAHATYFLNGGVEKPYPGEEYVLVDSRKDVATHDLAPEMKTKEVVDEALTRLDQDFIFLNFANADMVGHTANPPAVKIAVETIDKQLERLVTAVTQRGGIVVITADHGNAEVTVDPDTGVKHTAHTKNLVPFIVTDKTKKLEPFGALADVAPTVLSLLGLIAPQQMTGKNLFI